MRLRCFAGRAEEGTDTHAQSSIDVPGRSFVVASLLRDSRAAAPGTTVLTQLGLRPTDVDQLQRDGILVLDGLLDKGELRQLLAELQDHRVRDRLGASPN